MRNEGRARNVPANGHAGPRRPVQDTGRLRGWGIVPPGVQSRGTEALASLVLETPCSKGPKMWWFGKQGKQQVGTRL